MRIEKVEVSQPNRAPVYAVGVILPLIVLGYALSLMSK